MRSFLLLGFVLLSFSLYAANYQRSIVWVKSEAEEGSAKRQPWQMFEDAVFNGVGRLPLWAETFELESNNAEVKITNEVFEPCDDLLSSIQETVNSEIKFSTEVGTSAGRNYLKVTVFPFVKRNNQLLKLLHFNIIVEEKPIQLKSAYAGFSWKPVSLFASGKWIKIRTKNKGIYKITYDQLRTWGFSNPEKVGLFGNGGYMLPLLNKDLQADDILAYPFLRGKDNAGKDCMFFYTSGNIQLNRNSVTGMISHEQNYYSIETYFYLSEQGNPKLIERASEITENAGRQVKSFQNYTFYEKELLNLISSGSQWFGERFIPGSTHTIPIALDNPDLTKPASITVAAAGRSSEISKIDAVLNTKTMGTIEFQAAAVSDATSNYAHESVQIFNEVLPTANFTFRLTYNASNSTSEAWLDYIGINYQSPLSLNADVLIFRGRGVEGSIPVSEFVVDKATAGIKILNVTDLHSTVEMPTTFSEGQLKFKSNSFTVNDYVAFNPLGASIQVPELVGEVVNQNLHAGDLCEMIIVSYPGFLDVANELAEFRRTNDQMTVQVVTPEQIYNEFSGGKPDPAAFRNYFRMCYDRGKQSGKNTLKYILLLGDGSFDNRNIQGKGNNLLPTYQSTNSLSPTESFVTDDFFVMLDENEGGTNGVIDLGIGRIPARTLEEAQLVLDKIKNYHEQEAMGSWRNVVTFIGDDGDNSTHMDQADRLANYVNRNFPAFFTDKIYFDAYRQLSTSGGEKYPDVTESINNRIKQGTLLLNYTGHANDKNLADENVVDIGVINSWNNYKRLPVFVTATCEFSRFDSNEKSAGEHFLFNPIGGGVGLFSTTRLVYSGANFVLNDQFFRHVFLKDEKGQNLRMGDVMRLAKAKANTGVNQLNFTLLADPSLRLAYPHLKVKTTSINGKSIESGIDTIKTLSVVTIKGTVTDNSGAKLSSFNGEIIPTVYDKVMPAKTLGNAGEEQMDYTVQNSIIYRGLASVTNGEFEFSFFVPKDISYKLDKGKILYYAYNETDDAQGYFDGFLLGGASNTSVTDNSGPAIDLYLNSESFQDGGRVSASSVLIAHIKDNTGINTAGIGIGHDITAVLDNDFSNIMVLNDYFQASKDKYTEGTIIFPLNKLTEGEHTLRIKVWDVLNNSSEKEIRFVVKDEFRIESVANYPNPMNDRTSFVFTHNQPDETFDVTLEIFQPSGNRIDVIQKIVGAQGTDSLPMEWIPASRQIRMVPGIYIYRITATANGKTTSGAGRLVYTHR